VPDAFDDLRIGRNAMTPPDDFAERLLGRIREELGMSTTTAVRDLYYLTFSVADVDRALAFFGPLFGWTESGERYREGGTSHANLATAVAMGIHDRSAPGTIDVVFVAEDLDEAVALVRASGGTADVDPSGDWATCTDGDGVQFGLSKQSHGELQPVGIIPLGNPGYITLKVKDESRGRRFFREVLGWQFEGGLANPGFRTVPMGLGADVEPGIDVYLKVDDVDAFAERVVALGGTAGERSSWPSGEGIPCTDDQGTRFWLYKPAPGY
jgi:predicted enzyme related to lactoylglutathione lyase